MLIEIIKGLWYLLFTARLKRSFDAGLVLATWLLTAFLLAVSIPHAIEVIFLYEKGDPASRELKAIASALTIELAAGLLFLIALHTRGLGAGRRKTLMVLAVPFLALTLRIQFSYYAGVREWPIYPLELALILPYGVVTCAIAVSFLWPLVNLPGNENSTSKAIAEGSSSVQNTAATNLAEYTRQWQEYAASLQASAEQALASERTARAAERAALIEEYEKQMEASVLNPPRQAQPAITASTLPSSPHREEASGYNLTAINPAAARFNTEQRAVLNRLEAATRTAIEEAATNATHFQHWTALEITVLEANLTLLDKARLLYNNTSHHRVRKEQAALARQREAAAAVVEGGNLSEPAQATQVMLAQA